MFSKVQNGELVYFRSDKIDTFHGFSTRLGGVSTLPHLRTLNLGKNRGDDQENVEQNYRIFLGALGIDAKDRVGGYQTHSTNVRIVGDKDCMKAFADTDGFVTNVPGVALTVMVADCIPWLFFDPVSNVIGAAHGGWKGSLGGIAAVTIDKMISLGANPRNIYAAAGAGIHPCCYEVGQDFYDEVTRIGGVGFCTEFVKPRPGVPGKYSADIVGMSKYHILSKGVPEENTDICPECTCCKPDLFFSHRYTKGLRGTMCAAIELKP